MTPHGPLGDDDLRPWIEAFRAGVADAFPIVEAMQGQQERLWNTLRQVIAADERAAMTAALAATALSEDRRAAYLQEMLDDQRAAVREAVFAAFVDPRPEHERDHFEAVTGEELDRLLRRGLLDRAGSVRIAAARLAFAAARGDEVAGELMVNAYAPELELRRWVLLAMGSARDAMTQAILEEAAAGDDEGFAACAERALAARRD